MATRSQRLLHALQDPGLENDAGKGLFFPLLTRYPGLPNLYSS